MKRCPQCEFIYEDDQSLCDMDGILLVFDSQQLPKPITPSAVSSKSQWRNRVVTSVAAIVLATVLGLVYFVSIRPQRGKAENYQSPVNASQPSVNAATPAEVSESGKTAGDPKIEGDSNERKADSSESATKPERKAAVNKPKSNVSPAGAAREATKKPKAKSASTQKTQSSSQTQKDDSKLGSLIKKTGRLLKKPFKF